MRFDRGYFYLTRLGRLDYETEKIGGCEYQIPQGSFWVSFSCPTLNTVLNSECRSSFLSLSVMFPSLHPNQLDSFWFQNFCIIASGL